jgi:hypothetical protein
MLIFAILTFPDPLDELTSLATKYFSPVTAGTVGPQPSAITFESPWSADEEGASKLFQLRLLLFNLSHYLDRGFGENSARAARN